MLRSSAKSRRRWSPRRKSPPIWPYVWTIPSEPPKCAPSFRRGDTNADGDVDISDATATFNWLFLGALTPYCVDATDANADGDVDITDGIFALNFLFLAGAEIALPGIERCGLDPTADELGCLAYEPCICGGIIGKVCEGISGCKCDGEDCDELFRSIEQCQAAYHGCPSANGGAERR